MSAGTGIGSIPPGLTIYGADKRVTVFTESLAYKAPSAQNYAGLAEEARFLGVDLPKLLDDLRRAGLPVDGMDPDWRLDREIYRLDFPARPSDRPDAPGHHYRHQGIRNSRGRPDDGSRPHRGRQDGYDSGCAMDPRSAAR